MVQRMVEGQKFHEIEEYAIALSAFKEPTEPVKNARNFTVYPEPLVEEYFQFVACKGRTELEWKNIRSAFLWKLKMVIKDMKEKTHSDDSLKYKEDPSNLEKMSGFIISHSESFEAAPFTIQRICELLISPDKHYNSLGKFLRALEKTINVISCVYPDGERITDADEMETEEVYEPLGEKGVENAFIDVKVDEIDMEDRLLLSAANFSLGKSMIAHIDKTETSEHF